MGGHFLLDLHDFEVSGVCVIEVRGEIDLATALDFRTRLMQIVQKRPDRKPPVVLDLSRVEYFDVQGVRVLEELSRYLSGQGRPLALAASPYPVHRILEIVAMERQIPSFESRLAALDSLKSTRLESGA